MPRTHRSSQFVFDISTIKFYFALQDMAKCILIAFCIIGLASAAVTSSNEIFPDSKSSMKSKCDSAYNFTCLKLDILSLIDKISSANTEYQLTNGVSLVREENINKTQNSKIVSGKLKFYERKM